EGTMKLAQSRVGGTIFQGYGMTETSCASHVMPEDAPLTKKLQSVGVPLGSMECKVMDVTTGAELGANQQGEIWMRGPNIMKGYLNNPEATAHTIDPDGYLHSGDIGYADDDGFFYVVDRLKELIKYKGLQVAPAELEAVLLSNPAIADAAVIPVPDEDAGELPKAFVVKRGDINEQQVMEYVASRVAPHKKIRLVEFVDAIPKSASGKILRRMLVEKERAAKTM
ncbi:MAG: AMP-binding protein, partial [Chloroflexota bacterium]